MMCDISDINENLNKIKVYKWNLEGTKLMYSGLEQIEI